MFLKLYLIALPIFMAIDAIWLGLIAKKFYQKYIGHLMKVNPDFIAASIFYLLFLVGMVIFVIAPAMEKGSWGHALGYGALFGVITYATFDLTNQALIKDWSVLVTIIDLIWGAFIAGTVSVLTYLVAQKIGL